MLSNGEARSARSAAVDAWMARMRRRRQALVRARVIAGTLLLAGAIGSSIGLAQLHSPTVADPRPGTPVPFELGGFVVLGSIVVLGLSLLLGALWRSQGPPSEDYERGSRNHPLSAEAAPARWTIPAGIRRHGQDPAR